VLLVVTAPLFAHIAPPDTPVVRVGPPASVPTLAPLVKTVTPSVVNIAIKGRIAQDQNPLFNHPFFAVFSIFRTFPPGE